MRQTAHPTALPDTGERYIPELKGNIQLEHLHRYAIACEYVQGKNVLDIACGEGYGAAILASHAHHVTGVDISKEVIAHAQRKYYRNNLQFKVGDCTVIPIDDSSVDVIVSFETIEHHDKHYEMLQEIARVLKPDGLLIISSPDKHEYSDVPSYVNPFHIKELYTDEFKQLLNRYFKNVVISGQRIVFGSGIFTQHINQEIFTFNLAEMGLREIEKAKVTGIHRPLYSIAFASNSQLPPVFGSILERPIRESDSFIQYSRKASAQINELQDLLSKRDSVISQRDHVLFEKDNNLQQKNQIIQELKDLLKEQECLVAQKEELLLKIQSEMSSKDQEIYTLREAVGLKDTIISEEHNKYINLQKNLSEEIFRHNEVLTQVAEQTETVRSLMDTKKENERQIALLTEQVSEREKEISKKEHLIQNYMNDIEISKSRLEEKNDVIVNYELQVNTYKDELYRVYISRSWRYTKGFRKISSFIKTIAMLSYSPRIRRVIKGLYCRLPAFLRNHDFIKRLKDIYKRKEVHDLSKS